MHLLAPPQREILRAAAALRARALDGGRDVQERAGSLCPVFDWTAELSGAMDGGASD